MVLGIVGLVFAIGVLLVLPAVASVLAIVFGARARSRLRQPGNTDRGRGMATAGLVTGIVGVSLDVLLVIAVLIDTL